MWQSMGVILKVRHLKERHAEVLGSVVFIEEGFAMSYSSQSAGSKPAVSSHTRSTGFALSTSSGAWSQGEHSPSESVQDSPQSTSPLLPFLICRVRTNCNPWQPQCR